MANKNHQENARTRIVKICKDIYKWVVVRPTFMAAFVILEGVFLKNENNTTESWREGSSYWGQRPHRPHRRADQPLREGPDKGSFIIGSDGTYPRGSTETGGDRRRYFKRERQCLWDT